jgi:nitrogen PTS system EIIA component
MKHNSNVEEIAKCLNIAPSIVERWVRQGRIPVRKKGDQCVFSQSALKRWAEANNLTFTLSVSESNQISENGLESLAAVMERGAVFYDIEGNTVEEVLSNAIEQMPFFKTEDQKKMLYESLAAREKLRSTGIGYGVAIPHPRTPLGYSEIPAFITTCFLKEPINYKAVDMRPVFVLFVLVSPSSKIHLHLLSRLSFFLRDENFIKFLNQKPDTLTFFARIAEYENRFEFPE